VTIHYIGLSSFLIENEQGFRILVDPFNDAPEWRLGPIFPTEFKGRPFGANIVLMSEPDADHAYAPGGWLQHAPATAVNSNPFPGLDLRGTVVYEHQGDVNIAWHYTVDGLRLAHFADHCHVLTAEQLSELGTPDIIFLAPPKVQGEAAKEAVRENIRLLSPQVVIWAHHLAPRTLPKSDDPEILQTFFRRYFEENASTNQGYTDETSFMSLCTVLENAIALNHEYVGQTLIDPVLEVNDALLARGGDRPLSILFRAMLARSASAQ
jgi:L-ascorbate metabolism protein UlaG (beta-lactamase superfamily)